MNELSAGIMKFEKDSIKFEMYPFECSIASWQKNIMKSEIRTIDIKATTATIQVGEELLFVHDDDKRELKRFAERNSIPIVNRIDYWDYLLKPIVEKISSEREIREIDKLLNGWGFSDFKIKQIRDEIREQVLEYQEDTFMFDEEEEYLGFMDVLFAMYQVYEEEQFEDFYWRSMKIAFSHKLV